MQVKLLRVLQERRVRPVGAHDELQVDARVIAATNRDLKKMTDEGTFREDLFYRISVIPIHLPPLRERAEDIPALIDHFVKKFCDQAGKDLTISAKTAQILEKYAWHGNVRELEHTIERAVALERSSEIQPEQLPDHITNYNPQRISAEFDLPEDGINLVSHLENLEKTYVVEALRQTGGNQTRAAELLKMPVRSLRHLLDKHSIRVLSAQMRSSD
jgi:two-component system response regulator PilR (NtrC family)